MNFTQSLNKFATEIDSWVRDYVLIAPVDGVVNFSGMLQENQNVTANQEIFIVDPGNSNFYGEVNISQFNMGKISKGDSVNIKLESYPFEQYGILKGELVYISRMTFKDNMFMGRVRFKTLENQNSENKIILKNGMLADAEIITNEGSLLQKLVRSVIKSVSAR